MERNFKVLDEDVDYLVGLKNNTGKFSAIYKAKEESLEEAIGRCNERGIKKPVIIKITTHELEEDI